MKKTIKQWIEANRNSFKRIQKNKKGEITFPLQYENVWWEKSEELIWHSIEIDKKHKHLIPFDSYFPVRIDTPSEPFWSGIYNYSKINSIKSRSI